MDEEEEYMDEIVKRLLESHRLDEMAYKKSEALRVCMELGDNFIEHFHEVYTKGSNDIDYKHHCQEMQSWYDKVSKIVLKNTKKLITNEDLEDWFFTRGSLPEYLFKDRKESEFYERFYKKLLGFKGERKIVDIIRDLMKEINK